MFTTLFVAAMLGHFVGDYVLQNQWMAIGKSQPGWHGHLACTVHVLLYTLAIAIFTGLYTPLFLLAVAAPHWLIDRFALAWYWIDFKNPVPHTKIWERGPLCHTNQSLLQGQIAKFDAENEGDIDWHKPIAPAPSDEMNVWKLAFAAPVYIMNDNTFHWVCLWLAIKFLCR